MSTRCLTPFWWTTARMCPRRGSPKSCPPWPPSSPASARWSRPKSRKSSRPFSSAPWKWSTKILKNFQVIFETREIRNNPIFRAPNQFLPVVAGDQQKLLQCLCRGPAPALQAHSRLDRLGLQAHYAKCQRHRPWDHASTTEECWISRRPGTGTIFSNTIFTESWTQKWPFCRNFTRPTCSRSCPKSLPSSLTPPIWPDSKCTAKFYATFSR